jgi:hypothetical protein
MPLRFLLPAMLGVTLLLPSVAAAGTAVTPNACLNSADVVDIYRQQDGTIAAQSALIPDVEHPSTTDALPGQQVTLSAGTFDFTIPEYLIKDGYAVGLLHAGANTISVRAWVAIKATNTVEGVRVIGPVTTEATTTITVDPGADDAYVSSTPPAYTRPSFAATTWTATGGDIVFSQGDAGALGSLPLNSGGGMRPVAGSFVVQMFFNGGTAVNSVFDCQPGKVVSEDYEGIGSTFLVTPAVPIDAEAGPQNVTCINEVGRFAARELDPARVELTADPFAAGYVSGTPYTLTGTRAKITLSPDTVRSLADFGDAGLITPDETYPVSIWVTLAGANTTEGTQTLKVDATYALHATSPGTWEPAEITVDLPDTTWTPTGGALRFSAAQPQTMPAQAFVGPVTGGPGGPIVTTTYDASPYGAVVLRLGTEANATTLDCSQAWFTRADDGIAYSSLGRLAPPNGSGGRYAIKSSPLLPALTEQPPIAPPPGPDDDDDETPPPPLQSAPGTPPPSPRASAPSPTSGALVSTSLKRDRKGRVALRLRCPKNAAVACAGTLRVRSASKVRVGRRSRVITVVAARTYRVAPGRSTTVRLRLSRDARRALRTRARLKVRVELTPAAGKTTRKTVNLRR